MINENEKNQIDRIISDALQGRRDVQQATVQLQTQMIIGSIDALFQIAAQSKDPLAVRVATRALGNLKEMNKRIAKHLGQ